MTLIAHNYDALALAIEETRALFAAFAGSPGLPPDAELDGDLLLAAQLVEQAGRVPPDEDDGRAARLLADALALLARAEARMHALAAAAQTAGGTVH